MHFLVSVVLHTILILFGLAYNRDETKKEVPIQKISFAADIVKKETPVVQKAPEQKEIPVKKEEPKPPKKEEKQPEKPPKKVDAPKRKEVAKSVEEIPEEKSTEVATETEKSPFTEENYELAQDGNYIARNQSVSGISYTFLSSPDPDYPAAAKKLRYRNPVSIKVKFLVDTSGNVQDIVFYGEDPGMGFRNEVVKSLKKWKMTPVVAHGKTIKMYFYKEFSFKQI